MYIFRWVFRLCLVHITDIIAGWMWWWSVPPAQSLDKFKVARWWGSWHSAIQLLCLPRPRPEMKPKSRFWTDTEAKAQSLCVTYVSFLAAKSYDWSSSYLTDLPEKNVWKHMPWHDSPPGGEITDNFPHCLSVFSMFFYNKHALLGQWRKNRKV